MQRHAYKWLAAAAAVALIAGPALAQTTIDSRSTTTTVAPVAPSVSSSTTKSEKTIDAFGNKVESNQSVQSGPGGTTARSSTEIQRSDGSSEKASREEKSAPAVVLPDSSSTTTTTTIRR